MQFPCFAEVMQGIMPTPRLARSTGKCCSLLFFSAPLVANNIPTCGDFSATALLLPTTLPSLPREASGRPAAAVKGSVNRDSFAAQTRSARSPCPRGAADSGGAGTSLLQEPRVRGSRPSSGCGAALHPHRVFTKKSPNKKNPKTNRNQQPGRSFRPQNAPAASQPPRPVRSHSGSGSSPLPSARGNRPPRHRHRPPGKSGSG